MYCEKCGAKLNDGAKFCVMCGAPVSIMAQAEAAPEMPAPKQGLSRPKVKLELNSLMQEMDKPQPAPVSLTTGDMDAAREAAAPAAGMTFNPPPRVAPKPEEVNLESTPSVDVSAEPQVQRTMKPELKPENPAMPKAPQPEIKLQASDSIPKEPQPEIKLTAEPTVDVSSIPEVQKTTTSEIHLTAEPEIMIPTLPDDEPQKPAEGVKEDGAKEEVKEDGVKEVRPVNERKPQAAAQPQQYQQLYGQQNFDQQQTYGQFNQAQYAAELSRISGARTMGIISIIAAFIIPIVGVICGAIGMSRMNNLMAPPQLEAQRLSARKLCKIGLILAVIMIVIGVILSVMVQMTAPTTYYY